MRSNRVFAAASPVVLVAGLVAFSGPVAASAAPAELSNPSCQGSPLAGVAKAAVAQRGAGSVKKSGSGAKKAGTGSKKASTRKSSAAKASTRKTSTKRSSAAKASTNKSSMKKSSTKAAAASTVSKTRTATKGSTSTRKRFKKRTPRSTNDVAPTSRIKNSRPDYVSIEPTRVLDTRSGFGAKRCRVKAYSAINVDVASVSGVPRNARAVAVNLTSLNAQRSGKVTAYAAGSKRPAAAHLSTNRKTTDRSFAIVPINKLGRISLATTAETDLVATVVGYFAHDSQYRPTTSTLAFDTRTRRGGTRGALLPGVSQRVTIPTAARVPRSAEAVVVSVTASGATKSGSLAVFADGAGYPATTDVSINPHRSVTRTLVVSPSKLGKLQIQSTTRTHVSVHVVGHFRAKTDLWMIPAKNIVNTKTKLGLRKQIAPGASGIVDLSTRGVPAYRGSAAVIRLTTFGAQRAGYANVYQAGYTSPLRSVTIEPGKQHTNTILVPIDSGSVRIKSTARTHVKMDLVGYLAKPTLDAGHIAVSEKNQCVASPNGTVKCWGWNRYGQLGNESRESASSPITVPGITDAAHVAPGYDSTCVLHRTKKISCWGRNDEGQLGNGTTIDSFEPVQVAGISNAVELVAGPNWYCARLTTGKVKCWGYNEYGQLGNGTDTRQTSPVFAKIPGKVTSLTAGYRHACAILQSQKLACWGYNSHNQTSTSEFSYIRTPKVHPQIEKVTSVAAGSRFTCATVKSGRVKCWGHNSDGQLGDGSTTSHSRPANVLQLRDVSKVVAGAYHACAVKRNGLLSCWGYGGHGQLGNGSTNDAYYPQTVANLEVVHDVSAGVKQTCAIRADRKVYCWGYTERYLLFPDTDRRTQPEGIKGF